ncbi:MAG: DNA polymerase III subunit gamma and tau [Pseudonocardia sp.]
MSLALYRKYRPASFADVVGQEHVTEPLRTALAAGRINHAYLFSGPRGCGKTSSARILARSLNCELGPTPDPCGACPSCIALAPEGSGNIDVIELDAASHGGVDDARELRDRAFYAPAESRYRVFIVDEAHMVTTQGFNALLKIVEEPPEHLVFIFATTEPDKVLPTIRSRTHHYPFRLIPPGTLRGLLERICADEGVTVAGPAFSLVIRAGGGSARDSLSVLDQLLAGAGPEGVTYERAVALLGVTDSSLIDDTVDALAALDGSAVFQAVDRLVEAGHDPRRFAADLLERLRDLMLLQAVPEAAARGLVNAPADELSRMADQAARFGPASLTRYAEILHTGLTEMRGATAPRLLLELLCARMLLPAASTDDASLLQRLERMERRIDIAPPAGEHSAQGSAQRSAAGGAASGHPESDRAAPARSAERGSPADAGRSADAGHATAAAAGVIDPGRAGGRKQPADRAGAGDTTDEVASADPARSAGPGRSGGVDAAAVRRVWPEILAAAKEASRSTGALLMNAGVKALEDGVLVLGINSAPLARRLSEQRNTDVIAAALRTVLGVSWRVRCDHDGAGAPATGTGQTAARVPDPPPPAGPQATAPGGTNPGGTHPGGTNLGGTHPGGPVTGGSGAGRATGGGPDGGGSDSGTDGPGPTRSSGSRASGRAPAGNGSSESAGAPRQPDRKSSTQPRRRPGSTRPGSSASRSSEPPPPEPPPDDEEEMLAEASAAADAGDSAAPRRDPEEVAIELLAAQLGARTVDERR